MTPPDSGRRNRSLLESLLSTHPGSGDAAALLQLADVLEDQGYILAGWQLDGPHVQVRFHGPDATVAASLGELRTAAAAMSAGHTHAWRSLVLQDGPSPSGHHPLPETFP